MSVVFGLFQIQPRDFHVLFGFVVLGERCFGFFERFAENKPHFYQQKYLYNINHSKSKNINKKHEVLESKVELTHIDDEFWP